MAVIIKSQTLDSQFGLIIFNLLDRFLFRFIIMIDVTISVSSPSPYTVYRNVILGGNEIM